MKILLLNYEYPPLGGGAGDISRHIAEGLARSGNEVCVISTWFKGEREFSEIPGSRLRIIRLKSARKLAYRSNPGEMISWIRACKRFLPSHLLKEGYDIVFANFALPGGEVAAWIKKHHQIPYVILSHGHDIPWFFPKQMFFYHLLTYFRIRRICIQSRALFVQSGEMLQNARKFLGGLNRQKAVLIHNGADFRKFFSDNNQRTPFYSILFAGRLVRQKGPMLFLEALRILKNSGIPFRAQVFGDGRMRREMETGVVAKGLSDCVAFHGWVEKEFLAEEYRRAHVMVAPSLNEGMSMALNEALASGLYVFTTAVSCNQSLIRQGVNGEIISTRDAPALARRLEAYFNEKFAVNYQVPPQEVEQFLKDYNWESIVLKYEAALKAAIAEATAG